MPPILAPTATADITRSQIGDITCRSNGQELTCSIDASQLEVIRRRAALILRGGIDDAFEFYPMNRQIFLSNTMKMFTADNLSAMIVNRPPIDERSHLAKISAAKSGGIEPSKAQGLGLIAKRIKMHDTCPELIATNGVRSTIDWESCKHYIGIDECSDVGDKLTSNAGLPFGMFAVPLNAKAAKAVIAEPSEAHYFTPHKAGSPIPCKAPDGAEALIEKLDVASGVNFIIRTKEREYSDSWATIESCTTPDGKVHSYDGMIFDLGVNAFIPIKVDINGQVIDYTIFAATVTFAASGWLSSIIDSIYPDSSKFMRYLGGLMAKDLLLISHAKGWME